MTSCTFRGAKRVRNGKHSEVPLLKAEKNRAENAKRLKLKICCEKKSIAIACREVKWPPACFEERSDRGMRSIPRFRLYFKGKVSKCDGDKHENYLQRLKQFILFFSLIKA